MDIDERILKELEPRLPEGVEVNYIVVYRNRMRLQYRINDTVVFFETAKNEPFNIINIRRNNKVYSDARFHTKYNEPTELITEQLWISYDIHRPIYDALSIDEKDRIHLMSKEKAIKRSKKASEMMSITVEDYITPQDRDEFIIESAMRGEIKIDGMQFEPLEPADSQDEKIGCTLFIVFGIIGVILWMFWNFLGNVL